MRVTDFNRAIVRTPGRSVVNGLREDASAIPDYEAVLDEHAGYVRALTALGVRVTVLEPLEAFPDSVFVEDPALVFGDVALLLRPGAPSRAGEREPMRAVLHKIFPQVLELGDGEDADGGDILVTRQAVLAGLSARTSRRGAEAIARLLAPSGRRVIVAETPTDVLHFKTAVALIDDETVLATPVMAQSPVFKGYRVLITPEGEDAAANALRVGDQVLIGAHYPRTAALLAGHGFAVTPVPVREIAKLDAGLSCLSLRWFEQG